MLFSVSSIFALKNYYGTLALTSKRSEALNMCINNLNTEKAKAYSSIISSEGTKELGNTEYNYKIIVSNYKKNGTEVVTGVKVIESVVTFETTGETQEVRLKGIKVE